MKRQLLLTIDGGNTNVVFGLFDGSDLLSQWRISTDVKRTADEYGVWLTQLIALDGIEVIDVSAAIVTTVVPQTMFPLTSLCERYFSCTPFTVENGDAVGIDVAVANPDEVGPDRLVNAVAAHAKYSGNSFGIPLEEKIKHYDDSVHLIKKAEELCPSLQTS